MQLQKRIRWESTRHAREVTTVTSPRLGAALALGSRARPLVALHGISRRAASLYRAFESACVDEGRSLLVPRFGKRTWPVFQRIDRRRRPDLALLELFGIAVTDHGMQAGQVDLFGYSGGAQLAHRMAMLFPERIGALHLGAAGWYTLPDPTLPYPVGLGPDPRGQDSLSACMRGALPLFLDRAITIHIGSEDTDPDDPALRRTKILDRTQGITRRIRAERYAEAIARAQRATCLPITVSLNILPQCGHDFETCARTGGMTALVVGRSRSHP